MKAIIFDMDGTLIDSMKAHYESLKIVMEENGYPMISEEDLHKYAGESMVTTINRVIQNSEKAFEMNEKRRAIAAQMLDKISVFDGVKETLKELKQNYRLAVATTSKAGFTQPVLEGLGLKKYFEVIVSGDMVKKAKPAPDLFLLALKKLGLPAEECIVIEDGANGVEAAKKAGLRVIAITNTQPKEDLGKADYIIKKMEKSKVILNELN